MREGTVRVWDGHVHLLYLKWVTNKVLLGTQGTQLSVKWQPTDGRGVEGWGEWIYVYG